MSDLALKYTRTMRGHQVAFVHQQRSVAATTVLYCPGLLSSAQGKKGDFLEAAAKEMGINYAALEYGGQGRSGGIFIDFRFEDWIDDVIHVMDVLTPRAGFLLVGSSLGAWLALHAALRRRHAVLGLLLVAPAVDITRHWQSVAAKCTGREGGGVADGGSPGDPPGISRRFPRDSLHVSRDPVAPAGGGGAEAATQLVTIPSNYLEGGGFTLRQSFLDEANQGQLLLSCHRMETSPLESLHCAVHILYSEQDDAVPPHLPTQLAADLACSGCSYLHLELLEGADHRLSRECDLHALGVALGKLHRHVMEGDGYPAAREGGRRKRHLE